MPISQNLRFTAAVPADAEFDDPPGAALIRRLSADLARAGWQCGDFDNWRDCGWSVVCRRACAEIEVVVAQIPDDAWMLQISPYYMPGLIGRLFGRQRSATAGEIHELALAVHRA